MRYNAAEVHDKDGNILTVSVSACTCKICRAWTFDVDAQETQTKEVFENFIAKLEDLKEKIGIKKTIKDYGIDEKYFLDTLDDMCANRHLTTSVQENLRYPLMKEIKEIYLKCYYGKIRTVTANNNRALLHSALFAFQIISVQTYKSMYK